LTNDTPALQQQMRAAILKRTCGLKTRGKTVLLLSKNYPESKIPKKKRRHSS